MGAEYGSGIWFLIWEVSNIGAEYESRIQFLIWEVSNSGAEYGSGIWSLIWERNTGAEYSFNLILFHKKIIEKNWIFFRKFKKITDI